MMDKTILVASSGCGPCVRLITLLECKGILDEFEIIDVDLEEDLPRLGDILNKNPELIEDYSPQCVIQKDDGTYGPCDIDAIWRIAESVIKDKPASDLD